MSLVIIMPRSITQNLTEVEERLTAVVFKSVMAKLESTHFKPTVVYLPRFKADTSQNLMNIIGEMGKKNKAGERRNELKAKKHCSFSA